MPGKLFLSHAHPDKQAAQELRRALEDSGVPVWKDALGLRGGDAVNASLEAEVKGARGLLLLWTPAANESEWVEREAGWAQQARQVNPEYRILVVLRDGVGRVSAKRLLGEELLFIPIKGAVEDAVSEIRRALGELAPSGRAARAHAPAPLLEEIVVSFIDPRIDETGGRKRAAARFRIEHEPAQGAPGRSSLKDFESPLGPDELEEIRWYLERYPGWPFGTFRERAEKLEANLLVWGRELYARTLGLGGEPTSVWRRASGTERRIILEVDDPGNGAGAAALLALPWELLADEEGYLFEGSLKARVVRRIPREVAKEPLPTADRLRVLLIIARPEEEGVGFIDPRASALSLIEALAPLGHRAELEVVEDGTFPALREALAKAESQGRPFHIVHFDGHGVYDRNLGLGMLCFENPTDAEENKLQRRVELVDAEKLGALLRERRVPLFVLEACQTAMADEKVTASVAARLLRAGVGSVLAMTHAVLVETARRFVGRFYERLAAGERIGTAMVVAEHYLLDDPYRGEVGGHGELHLQDWFVPVLFQEKDGDLQLLQAGSSADPQALATQRKTLEGDLPPVPAHGFVGRARELLVVQRRLRDERVLALLGEGGQGKTALAVECARWLLDLRHVERVAFATVEDLPDARVLLDRLGRQLVPGYSVAVAEGLGTEEERLRQARLPVERVLAERRVLLVVDNLESILPAPDQPALPGLGEMLALMRDLAEVGETRLLLTSRESPPAPLNGQVVRLGRLSRHEGRELVAGVLARAGRAPAGDAEEEWIDDLIERVAGHARSLVLLAPLVVEQGLKVTAESVKRLLMVLEERHPGARELSLLASVRLSLDRLPDAARKQVRALAVFHGGAHFGALAHVLEVEPDEALELCRQLVNLGLAEADGPYLFPDPALGEAVAGELSEKGRTGMEERWLEAILSQINGLYKMQFNEPEQAAKGTRAVLKDLLPALAAAEERVGAGRLSADLVMGAVTSVQQLASALSLTAVLSRVVEIRKRIERWLVEWSHARFIYIRSEIEQMLASGDVKGALQAAEWLKEEAEAHNDAYPEAPYDQALACAVLGTALRRAGRAADALSHYREAERRFTELTQAGDHDAAGMLSVVAVEKGNALLALGRLDEAVEAYELGITIAEKVRDQRGVAVGRAQVGAVRLQQGRLPEALEAFEKARDIFEALGEPLSVATAWYQIGLVLQVVEQWDRAEAAYQRSLRIEVEHGNKSGQALTLGQLGVLYGSSARSKEAAQLFEQAVKLFEDLGDPFNQAKFLSNLAIALRSLGRLDAARDVANHSARLSAPFGHTAEPWKTFNILREIEARSSRFDAASAARSRAIELYAAYRQDGGEPTSSTARLIAAVCHVLQSSEAEDAHRMIPPPEQFEERLLPVRDALLGILDGSRDPALAQDDRLDYDDAAELALLLESLQTG